MGQNILITGGGGYIGGSLISSLITSTNTPIKAANITATVRQQELVQKLKKVGVNAIHLDLKDEAAVTEVILRDRIDIVVNTATSFETGIVSNLIKALGQRRKVSGEEAYFIHSSVTAIFSAEAGWPFGQVDDSGPVFSNEKKLGYPHPVHDTNVYVVEEAKKEGVTSFNMPLPTVYGKGSGEGRKISVAIASFVRAAVANKVVYRFDKDGSPGGVHISDLMALYILLLENIMQKNTIPSGDDGYYLAVAHRIPTWELLQRIAESLHARGLVKEPKTEVWPSDEMAAESLEFPLRFVQVMSGTTTGDFVPTNAFAIGWQPKWDKKRFLSLIDNEVQNVLELGAGKNTIFDSLMVLSNK